MPDFVPNNCHLRKVLIFVCPSEKTHQEPQNVYGEAALSQATYRDLFRRFKNGDFDVDSRQREKGQKP